MREFLVIVVGMVMLFSVVHSFIWFNWRDKTRLAISGMYAMVSIFAATRLFEMLHALSNGKEYACAFNLIPIILPAWSGMLGFNILMSIAIIINKRSE